MAATIVAFEKPVSHIFNNDYVFKIPSYQRPYAWTTDEARDLIDDLTGFMGINEGPVEDMPPYFLGSIVLIKQENAPKADIVDGQQRLTTLTLLLSAIRSRLDGKDRSDITHLIYESGSTILGTQDRFRLSLRELDREFFQKFVQRDGGLSSLLELSDLRSDSQRNIQSNARLFVERVDEMTVPDRLRLAQFIVTRCYLVVVATPDLDAAYRIFSVLNSRGLDLSATDILKADIIGAIPDSHRDSYTQKWERTEEDLGREDFVDLFSQIRMVYRKAKPKGTLLKEFRDHVIVRRNTSAELIDDVLLPMAEVYEIVTDSAFMAPQGGGAVNEHLRWLNRLEFKDWLPPALRFTMEARNDPQLMTIFFGDMERLAYWMLLTRKGINDRIDRFSRLTDGIDKKDLSSLQLSKAERKAAREVLGGEFYNLLSARARSNIVLRLDSLLSGGGATYDYKEITLEHVCPQNPDEDSCWTNWIPDDRKRASLVHQLGNLVLLTRKKNSSASNYEFDRKKKVYFTQKGVSPFVLTTQVLQHDEWTEPIIKQRQLELFGTMVKHWRLADNL